MSVRLLQFTDPHLFGDTRETLRGTATYPALSRVLAAARSAYPDAMAWLVTGDLVQDDPGGYQSFRALFDTADKPVLCIPGNHDDVRAMSSALATAPYQLCGERDFGAWRVIMLDSAVPGAAHGTLSQASLARLDRSLAGAADRHALVCLHHHPIDMDSRWLDEVGLTNRDEFFRVIDRHEHVRAIAWGHVHQALDTRRRDVRLLATPATCAQFLPRSDDFAIDLQPPAYRVLTLEDDGSLDTSLEWVN